MYTNTYIIYETIERELLTYYPLVQYIWLRFSQLCPCMQVLQMKVRSAMACAEEDGRRA
jgi:hypothetical protein